MSTAETDGLIEFLKARIAEDEAQAHNVLVFRMNPETRMPGNQAIPDRVRAECAAKRAVVGRYEEFYATRRANWMNPNYAGAMEELKWALQTLAAIYADHADYRQEWVL